MQSAFSAWIITSACSLARQREHVEDLAVAQFQRIVGHVDLERGVAVADQRRQFLAENLRRRIGDDEVERIVDDGHARGAAVVVLNRGAQALALLLRGERHHRRGAAARRRARAGEEVIGHDGVVARRLVEMAVGVDAAGQHEQAARVDLALARRQTLGERGDPAVAHADVGVEHVDGGGDLAAAHDKVEFGHSLRFPPNPRFEIAAVKCLCDFECKIMNDAKIAALQCACQATSLANRRRPDLRRLFSRRRF